MITTKKEILDLKSYLVNTYHSKRIKEQEIDQQFYEDTFDVPFVNEEAEIVRTGKAARMVDGPAEHIITSNPQVFREPRKKGEVESCQKISKELNRWANLLLWQSPQPYKETVKNLLLRGEAWHYNIHNNNYDPNNPNDTPAHLIVLDPLIVYIDPGGGEKYGQPASVLLSYDRVAWDIKRNYPNWLNKKNKGASDKVPFLMYWNEEIRYFEADDEPLLPVIVRDDYDWGGLQENIYGFPPFVHIYSGFGRGSADGDPASLAVGRLRWVRDLLREQCAIRSTLATLIYKYAHKSVDLFYPAGGPEPSGDIGENYSRGLNAFNQIGLPDGSTLEVSKDLLPEDPVFKHLYKVEADIVQEDPLGTVGQAIGTSGRQQDMARESALRRYDTIVDNTAYAFAKSFGQHLMMCEKLPNQLPSGIRKGDIDGYYTCRVELKAKDPVEQDRLKNMGRAMWEQGSIDHETFLTDYAGYTQEQALEIMDKILVDNAIRNNPIVAEIIGQQVAKEMGMEEQYQALMEAQGLMKGASPMPQIGSKGGTPRRMNIKTERGLEEADMSVAQRGARRSPEL